MTSNSLPNFELPGMMERLLATLTVHYGKTSKDVLQGLLVNAQYHIEVGTDYDNWDGGTFGHRIHLKVPTSIYINVIDNVRDIENTLREDINSICNVKNEYIHEVFIELLDDQSLENWRENSGLMIVNNPSVAFASQSQLSGIWHQDYLRLFISHKADIKVLASDIKENFDFYGVSCFVAHEDIEPTKEWQREIEKALFSMDCLVALLTENFGDSKWTDQEVGVAFGKQIPIIPVLLGTIPYGFIGKYQALQGNNKSATELVKEIYTLLWTKPQMKTRLIESLVNRFETSKSYNHANSLMEYLLNIDNASPTVIDQLEQAPSKNRQVRDAYEVKSSLPGLLKKLRRNVTSKEDSE